MKVEDTVMDIGEERYDGLGADTLVQIQAEITWDKAIREVVDKLKEHPDFYKKMLDNSPDWQAQLKEWGIK